MINIVNKIDCCGCSACVVACPKECIVMDEDSEGFLYPKVQQFNCINCELCEQVCPVLNPFKPDKVEPEYYACYATDENIRLNSSSGGLFSLLAEQTINKGGVVFGASFNEKWEIVHEYTNNINELSKFRGSKYVQSNLKNTFKEVKNKLIDGIDVLFCGTPCQVAGLNHYISKYYSNLTTIDFVCHSIPSPKIFRDYISKFSKKRNNISEINFRDKTFGWDNYSLLIKSSNNKTIIHESHNRNTFMKAFLRDIINRPSCSKCPSRNYLSKSDITISDFWGIKKYIPKMYSRKGVSLALVHSEKGRNLFSIIQNRLIVERATYQSIETQGLHSPITSSSNMAIGRKLFFKMCNKRNVRLILWIFTITSVTNIKVLLIRIFGKKLSRFVKKAFI